MVKEETEVKLGGPVTAAMDGKTGTGFFDSRRRPEPNPPNGIGWPSGLRPNWMERFLVPRTNPVPESAVTSNREQNSELPRGFHPEKPEPSHSGDRRVYKQVLPLRIRQSLPGARRYVLPSQVMRSPELGSPTKAFSLAPC